MPIELRRAREADVPAIVRLIVAASRDGGARERDPASPRYLEAFREIDGSPAQVLLVADDGGAAVGTLLFTVFRQIANHGGLVAEVENVAVAPDRRGQGIGEQMMRWSIDEARRRGCVRVQLTSNKARVDAHRFYARLGFEMASQGFKLVLT